MQPESLFNKHESLYLQVAFLKALTTVTVIAFAPIFCLGPDYLCVFHSPKRETI
jgi:hypothetical protein